MKTGGLLVFHHGLLTWDLLYLMSELYVESGVKLGGIIDRFLYNQVRGLATVSMRNTGF